MAAQEWVTEKYAFLLLAAFVALAALAISSKRRRALASAESPERDVPFALRDLDLTPEAAEGLNEHLESPSALPTRPLRSVAVAGGPAPVA